MTTCPHCHRQDGHYLGCKELEPQTSVKELILWSLGGIALMMGILALLVVIFGG